MATPSRRFCRQEPRRASATGFMLLSGPLDIVDVIPPHDWLSFLQVLALVVGVVVAVFVVRRLPLDRARSIRHKSHWLGETSIEFDPERAPPRVPLKAPATPAIKRKALPSAHRPAR